MEAHRLVEGRWFRRPSFTAWSARAWPRKKTDKRDAYWIAKALASGMTPHPVYIPDAKIRVLRSLLSIRKGLTGERNRWQMRARSALRAAGVRRIPRSGGRVAKMRMLALSQCDGLDAHLDEVLSLCQRQQETASLVAAVARQKNHPRRDCLGVRGHRNGGLDVQLEVGSAGMGQWAMGWQADGLKEFGEDVLEAG